MSNRVLWSPTGNIWVDLFRLFCHGLVVAIFASFLGEIAPIGDSLAVFRIEMTVLLALSGGLAFLLERSFIPAVAAITVLGSVLSFAPHAFGTRVQGAVQITVHQHNLLYKNYDLPSFVAHVKKTKPDVLTLQELSQMNLRLIGQIEPDYPNFQVCRYATGGVGVFVRDIGRPTAQGCAKGSKLAWIQVETPAGKVTFASLHLFWPWPMQQFWQLEDFTAAIAALPQPVIIGGDFNMVPWASSVRNLAKAANGFTAPGIAPTFHIGPIWPAFRIDHVIVPEGSQVESERLPKLGSDHNGIRVGVRLTDWR